MENTQIAEQKRLQSLAAKRKEYKNNVSIIKSALNNIDAKPNNKITFDDNDNDDNDNTTLNSYARLNGNSQTNKSLFSDGEDEDDHDNYNFEVKEQFQGKKGKKLLELQSKYKGDKRFMLDERYLDEDENDQNAQMDVEDDLSQEKEKQFAILEEVLGKKFKPKETTNQNKTKILTYDPSQENHIQFEDNNEENESREKRKTKKESKKEKQLENQNKVEVSEKTFYKVADNLKDVFEQKQSFSLLSAFGREDVVKDNTPTTEIAETIKSKSSNFDNNPFKYDSSEDEAEETEVNEIPSTQEPSGENIVKLNERKLWTEPFFFKNDDFRLQEGIDFIKQFETGSSNEFSKVRRSIKEIVKAKFRHNQRKNKPFKKKLGGKKKRTVLKLKKALKR